MELTLPSAASRRLDRGWARPAIGR